jgi:hypothetical protein
MQVVALIGDIVDSKELSQRAALQQQLAGTLKAVGRSARGLASPYTLTLGDEFQAVYRAADSIFADIVTIMAEVHPIRVRFALGVGALTTRINAKQALGMDGPAFHLAREALLTLKEDGRLLRLAGMPADRWKLANHVLNLWSHQIAGWERNRLQILAGLLRGRKVREIEAGLSVSTVAVYKNIRAAALDEVVGICQELTAAMNAALTAK